MKIAFLSNKNPNYIHLWSGTTHHIYHILSQQHEVAWLGRDLTDGGIWYHRFKGKSERKFKIQQVLF